jgi:sigma-B regulation protein RsbQ
MATRSLREVHGATIHGRPSRPALLLVHGYGCDQTMWGRLVPHLSDEFLVVTYDQAGAGAAVAAHDPRRHQSLDGYADDLVALCEELRLEDVVVVGHSVSAMIGVLAHLQRPDLVIGLTMITPSPRFIDAPSYVGGFSREDVEGLLAALSENFDQWAEEAAPRLMGASDRPDLAAELARTLRRTDPAVAEAFARVTFLSDSRHLLQSVQCPALVIQAAGDPMAPEPVGRYVHDQIDASSFVQLEATGHFPHVSAPEETATAILGFLRPISRFLERTRP